MKKLSETLRSSLSNLMPLSNNEKIEVLHYIFNQEQEIKRLKKGYCPIKEKCNKGECDCTNEEYNQMCEENIKLDLEIERLNKEIKRLKQKILIGKKANILYFDEVGVDKE